MCVRGAMARVADSGIAQACGVCARYARYVCAYVCAGVCVSAGVRIACVVRACA